jgi:hypothetical protein
MVKISIKPSQKDGKNHDSKSYLNRYFVYALRKKNVENVKNFVYLFKKIVAISLL